MRFATMLTAAAGLALSGVSAVAARAQSPAVPTNAALDSLVTKQMTDAGIMGLGAAVVVNVGSIAKPFLGVAMMRAVQEGKLSLDEISTSICRSRWSTHTAHRRRSRSGTWRRIPPGSRTDGRSTQAPTTTVATRRSPSDAFSSSTSHRTASTIRVTISSTPGPARVATTPTSGPASRGIVERAFGEPLNVYTRKHIFTPLRMMGTGWFLSEVDLANHSTLFVSQNGSPIPIPHYGFTTYPDGGVRTSVADLSKFFIALLNGGEYQGARILDAGMAAEMLRFQFTDANRPENYPAAGPTSARTPPSSMGYGSMPTRCARVGGSHTSA